MKKHIILLYSVMICLANPVWAQIGINTEYPKGIFNIDTYGDNIYSSDTKTNDDVVFRLNSSSEANLVIGGKTLSPLTAASLELNATNKAMLLNRVILPSLKDNMYGCSLPLKEGMLVYNTHTTEEGEGELGIAEPGNTNTYVTPGLYIYNGIDWDRLQDESIESIDEESYVINLTRNATSKTAGNGGSILSITPASNTASPYYISIPEDGKYMFFFRIYGSINALPWHNYNQKFSLTLKEYGGSNSYGTRAFSLETYGTYQTNSLFIVTDNLEKGTKVSVILTHEQASLTLQSNSNHTAANRTSFVYWRLK